MGRLKIKEELKKDKLSVTISKDNFLKFEEFEIKNKSKLINWLLLEHFDITPKAKEGGCCER
jgi:hypothetical protein